MKDSPNLPEWLKGLPKWILAIVAFVSGIFSFVNIIRGNYYLGVTIIVVVLLASLLVFLIFVASATIESGIVGPDKQTIRRYRFHQQRPWALAGVSSIAMVFALLLLFDDTRSFAITALVGTSTPTSTPTATITPTPTPTVGPTPTSTPKVMQVRVTGLNALSEIQPDGKTKYTTYLDYGTIGEGKLEILSPNALDFNDSAVVRVILSPDPDLQNYLASSSLVVPSYLGTAQPRGFMDSITPFPPARSIRTQTSYIKIYPFMTAELTGVGFEIAPRGPQTKAIVSNLSSTWSWSIAAKRSGNQELLLKISIPVFVENAPEDVSVTIREAQLAIRVTGGPIEPTETPGPISAPPLANGERESPIFVFLMSFLAVILGGLLLFRKKPKE